MWNFYLVIYNVVLYKAFFTPIFLEENKVFVEISVSPLLNKIIIIDFMVEMIKKVKKIKGLKFW